jgi:anti-anti-sigma regulatory factor
LSPVNSELPFRGGVNDHRGKNAQRQELRRRGGERKVKRMVTMEALPSQGIFIVRYTGEVTVAQLETELPKVPAILGQLEPGFAVLVDLTDLTSMDVKCAPLIEEIMDRCQERGVTEIVRVIPNPNRDIGLQIMSHFHYDKDVRISTCDTLDEATALLGV